VSVTLARMSVILPFPLAVDKEVTMQRRRRNRFESEQTNLFHPKRVRPAWRTLPMETREQVTKLVARLLRLSACEAGHTGSADAEVEHD
jgi:hypothetical protein